MKDVHNRCKRWIESQFDKLERLLVFEMIAEAQKRFPLEEGEIMQIVTEVLREGCSV